MSDPGPSDDRMAAAIRRAFRPYAAPSAVPPVLPHPAAVRRRRLLGLSLVAAPTAALLTIALAMQTLVQPTSAFATWKVVPDEPTSTLTASAPQECSTQLPLIALDQRGRAAVALFSDGVSLVDCLLVDGMRSASSHGAQTGLDPSAGAIEVLNHGRYERESTVHIFSGGVRSEVVSVVVTREDGLDVTATVAGGVFVVWWPAAEDAATFRAIDAAGNVIEVIDNPMRLPPTP